MKKQDQTKKRKQQKKSAPRMAAAQEPRRTPLRLIQNFGQQIEEHPQFGAIFLDAMTSVLDRLSEALAQLQSMINEKREQLEDRSEEDSHLSSVEPRE